jgi:transglutaminase-like putative cysteine protease
MTSVPTPVRGRPASSALEAVKGSGVLVPAAACVAALVLASLSLAPVLATGAWFGPVLTVTLVVVGLGAVAMWLRLPLFLVPVLQVVALFSVLVAKYTDSAVWGFLPSTDSLADLRTRLTDGMHDINVYAPPVPVTPGVAAVAALGIGCLAIVVFVLQVALRLPVLAGLALVGVYVVPSFVLDDGSPWWSFAALAVAFMVLLVSDERVGLIGWGRMLRRSEGTASSPFSGLSSAALRIGVAAIAAAIVLPVLLPGLADLALFRGATGIGPGGSGSGPATGALNPLVELRRHQVSASNAEVFTYVTEPGAAPGYLPEVVLTTYKAEAWIPQPYSPQNGTPVADGIPADSSVNPIFTAPETRRTTSFASSVGLWRYLPMPEHYTGVTVGDDGGTSWFVDPATKVVFADQAATQRVQWKADWNSAEPTAEQLAAVPAEVLTPDEQQHRPALPPTIATVATDILNRSGASTPFEKARAIQDYFHNKGAFTSNNFIYSTDVPDPTSQPGSYLDQFLVDQKGYCQQYAAAMALLSEAMGIRARVVVGYTQGHRTSDGHFLVEEKDAHAWPELFFAGFGWVRFEPTPSAGVNGTVSPPAYTTAAVTTPSGPSGAPSPGSTCIARGKNSCRVPSPVPTSKFGDPADSGTGALTDEADAATSADTWRLRGILLVLAIGAAIAAVPALVRLARRRRRLSEQAAIEDMWEELRDTALDLGVPWSTSHTPRQAVAAVVAGNHLRGEAAEAATRLGTATERARYAPTAPSSAGVADDVTVVRRALWRRADRGQKWRAVLLPSSLRRHDDARR